MTLNDTQYFFSKKTELKSLLAYKLLSKSSCIFSSPYT